MCIDLTGDGGPNDAARLPKVIVRPRKVQCPAVRQGLAAGEVELALTVGCDGRVSEVRVLKGIGQGCDQIAAAALQGARFTPARSKDGRPVTLVISYSYVFVAIE